MRLFREMKDGEYQFVHLWFTLLSVVYSAIVMLVVLHMFEMKTVKNMLWYINIHILFEN
jgi:hypothetical protein